MWYFDNNARSLKQYRIIPATPSQVSRMQTGRVAASTKYSKLAHWHSLLARFIPRWMVILLFHVVCLCCMSYVCISCCSKVCILFQCLHSVTCVFIPCNLPSSHYICLYFMFFLPWLHDIFLYFVPWVYIFTSRCPTTLDHMGGHPL